MAWITYKDLQISSGSIQWSYSGFERQLDSLVEMHVKSLYQPLLGSRVNYLQAQRELIEADDDFDCELLGTKRSIAYLRPCIRKQGRIMLAKAIFYEEQLIGVASRPGRSEERFRFTAVKQLASWMLSELEEPSLNFCTVFGEYD